MLPLIVGSIWIYRASAGAFEFQRTVREAQNARGRVVRAFLSTESDIRGFAATRDPYFADAYHVRVRTFGSLAAILDDDLKVLSIGPNDRIVSQERQTYAQWNRMVAIPILIGARSQASHVLQVADPALAGRMLTEDDELTALLNDAAARSESERQQLLRRILFASIALVASVATLVIVLLLRQAAIDRARLKQTLLYDEERRVSRVLESAFAPAALPAVDHIELSAIYVPASEERNIGGDWYDAVPLQNGLVLLIIGDVAGHGLEAAVVMSRVRLAMAAAAVMASDPKHILRMANQTLTAQSAGLVTAACCLFEPNSGRLIYASAGHPPPVIVPPYGQAYALPYGGPPLGLFETLMCETSIFSLERGSTIIFYTDGLIEQARDVIASESSLLVAAGRCRLADDPAKAIFAALLPEEHPRDDVAILTVRLRQGQ